MENSLKFEKLTFQMELQDVDKHAGIYSWVCREACYLMKLVMATSWSHDHVCYVNAECTYCESKIVWHQLCLQLLTYMAPSNLAHPPDVSKFISYFYNNNGKSTYFIMIN